MAIERDDIDVYLPPEIDPRDVAILNALHARRQPIECTVAGMSLRIAPIWAEGEEPGLGHTPIALTIDQAPAELTLHPELTQALFAALGPGLAPDRLSSEHAALVLELALKDALAQIEASARVKIAVVSVGQGEGWIQDSLTLCFSVSAQHLGASWCWLTLPRQAAGRLAALISRTKAPRAPVVNAVLPLALRTGHVTLTLDELRSLRPGDILLAEEACAPATAAAVIAEHMAAPAELTAKGVRLAGPPAPLARSRLAWSGGTLPRLERALDGHAGSIPVRVFFELGRQTISVTDLAGLGTGTVLPAATGADDLIDIIAQGRRIGRGEPVSIGEGRGLRIARLTPHD